MYFQHRQSCPCFSLESASEEFSFAYHAFFLAFVISCFKNFSFHKIRSVAMESWIIFLEMQFWWKFLLFYKAWNTSEFFYDENNLILLLDFLSRSEKGSFVAFTHSGEQHSIDSRHLPYFSYPTLFSQPLLQPLLLRAASTHCFVENNG